MRGISPRIQYSPRQTPHPSQSCFARLIHPLPQGERGRERDALRSHLRSLFTFSNNKNYLAARCVRGSHDCVPPKKRGSGEHRVRAAPAVSRANLCEECAHEHTGSAETLRHSPRNGFTAYGALSSATNSSCHRHRRIEGLVEPGWARKTSADLTPATGARTTRFCRTQHRRSSCASDVAHGITRPAISAHTDAAASTASRPTFVTMANAPLSGTR